MRDSAPLRIWQNLVGKTVSAAFGMDRVSKLNGGRGDHLRHRFEPGIDAEYGGKAYGQIDDGLLVID